MKIDYAIHSSDSNKLYLDFWPIVSEIWLKKFSIIPILVYIDAEEKNIDETYGIVINMKPIKGIPIHSQAQIVRFWVTSLYPEKVSIISDIDMIPLSIDYFHNSIKLLNDYNYIHLNPCIESYGRLPACYHVAKGNVFKEVLEIDTEWETFLRKVLNYCIDKSNFGHTKESWFADDLYSSDKVLEFNNRNRICFIKRKRGIQNRRIDRINWNYNKLLLKFNYYFDSHSIRPFSEFNQEIIFLKDMTINSNSNKIPEFFIIMINIILYFKLIICNLYKFFYKIFFKLLRFIKIIN
jgi:hypothetical protein